MAHPPFAVRCEPLDDWGAVYAHTDGHRQDLTMPRTMVMRLAKGMLPPNTQIQKDAVSALSKGTTVFMSYLAAAAQAHTAQTSRKTVSPQDVLSGLRECELDGLLRDRLTAELAVFSEAQAAKRNEYRRRQRAQLDADAERLHGSGGAGEPSIVGGGGVDGGVGAEPDARAGAAAGASAAGAGAGAASIGGPGGDEMGIQAQLAAEMAGAGRGAGPAAGTGPREVKRRRKDGSGAAAAADEGDEEMEDVDDDLDRYGAEEEEDDVEFGGGIGDDESESSLDLEPEEDELARLENEYARGDDEGDSTEEDETMEHE